MSISATASQPAPLGRRIKRFMSDYPLVPLIVLLLLLVGQIVYARAMRRRGVLS